MSHRTLTEEERAEHDRAWMEVSKHTARQHFLNRIAAERARQIDLPGSEADVRNTPNEWAAIASHYLTQEVRRGGYTPDRETFEDTFVKAAAVILAALEYGSVMQSMGHLRGDVSEEDVSSFRDALAKLNQD